MQESDGMFADLDAFFAPLSAGPLPEWVTDARAERIGAAVTRLREAATLLASCGRSHAAAECRGLAADLARDGRR